MRPLPEALIDQIAAGEVVERPASVVKELVENALDAGARRIRVEVRGGGRDFVAVTDDGSGMPPEDARLSLRRHATSKISSANDLESIATYGFRGEALPAIASVSRLTLRTRAADATEAFEIRVDHGRPVEERAAGGPIGTRVEVADLFGSVPARRKFLKTEATEWGHITDWLARAALVLPGVHWDLQRDDRPATVWPGCASELDRIAAVLGEATAEAMVPLQRTEGQAHIRGFVSRPDRHRPTMAGIYLFANDRPVRDRMVQHALVEVYRDVLPRGRFPSAVLFLDVPPEAIDVNVHPAKWEVRFADPRAVHSLVRHAVRDALGGRAWLGERSQGIGEGGQGTDAAASMATSWPAARRPGPGPAPGREGAAKGSDAWAPEHAAVREGRAHAGQEQGDWIFAGRAAESRVRFGELELLGQLMATYLVVEGKDRMLLVDQHAAHERVLYERLRADWRARQIESQQLLVPVTVALEPGPLRAVGEAREGLSRLGFEVDEFGGDAVAVRAVPGLLAEREPAALVRDLADELAAAQSASGSAADALREDARILEPADRIFANLACHSARRKGDVLDPREQRALLDALDAIPWAPTCPHGRPVAVPFELSEIERRFGRR